MPEPIVADYVVIGCGAAGMAFADTLVRHSNATVAMIDRHDRPGGHWNNAYPFVQTHMPSHYYGVESHELGPKTLHRGGLNDGLMYMATAAEIVAYYERVMESLRATGRVTYLPMSEYDSDGVATSRLTGAQRSIVAGKRVVDATFARTNVPATHTRPYRVADGVACIPINGLSRLDRAPANYCVVGAGKTGADACLWLLSHGVPADRIRWIMPRDSWWMNRAKLQFEERFFQESLSFVIGQMEAIAEATSVDDLFAGFEARGLCFRIDPSITPTYQAATMSPAELVALRRIRDIVRLGRVTAIEADQLVLERGAVDARPDTLYVDCSAAALTAYPTVPVFAERKITLQWVRAQRPCFSAAMIGFVEARAADDPAKNALCTPVPVPGDLPDWVRHLAISMTNQVRWAANPELMRWMAASRLDPGTALMMGVGEADTARKALVDLSRAKARAAAANMPKLLERIGA